jgi:hypothetical protein
VPAYCDGFRCSRSRISWVRTCAATGACSHVFVAGCAGLLSAHGPFWPLLSKFLSGAAAAGGIALINSLANLSGFAGPYAIGLLNNASGNFRSGLLLLACVPLVGMALALKLRHAAVLKDIK